MRGKAHAAARLGMLMQVDVVEGKNVQLLRGMAMGIRTRSLAVSAPPPQCCTNGDETSHSFLAIKLLFLTIYGTLYIETKCNKLPKLLFIFCHKLKQDKYATARNKFENQLILEIIPI